jgi:hypothetical protein
MIIEPANCVVCNRAAEVRENETVYGARFFRVYCTGIEYVPLGDDPDDLIGTQLWCCQGPDAATRNGAVRFWNKMMTKKELSQEEPAGDRFTRISEFVIQRDREGRPVGAPK